MSVISGFFNSVSGDRKYNADQMSEIFEGIIEDGVFEKVGDALAIKANPGDTDLSNMYIYVGTGRAWFNNRWIKNDAILPLKVDDAELVLNRIDIVVAEVNKTDPVRECFIKIIKGTPASNPVAPTLITTATLSQHPLARISVKSGVTSISQADITALIGTDETPYVTGPLSIASVSSHLAQWDDQFNTWFENLNVTLDGDVAANLANRVITLEGDVDSLESDMVSLKKSVSEGKTKVASALTQVSGQTLAADASFDEMANFILTKMHNIYRGSLSYPSRRTLVQYNLGFRPKTVVVFNSSIICALVDEVYGSAKSADVYALNITQNGFEYNSEYGRDISYIAIR